MTRKNTWIDYGNLGANLVQAVQLSGVRHNLATQVQLSALEQAKEETEGKLRQSVFEADSLLRNLTRAKAQNLLGTLALARESALNIKRNSVYEYLQSYTDKEKLRAVEEGFEALAADCSSSLSAEDRERAEDCAQYRVEEGALASAISIKSTREQLDAARAEVQSIDAQTGSTTAAEAMIKFGAFCLLFGVIFTAIPSVYNDDDKILPAIGWLLLLVGGLTGSIGAIICVPRWLKRANANADEKSRKVTHLERLLVDKALASEDVSQWGNKSLAELQQIRQERAVLVAEVLDAK